MFRIYWTTLTALYANQAHAFKCFLLLLHMSNYQYQQRSWHQKSKNLNFPFFLIKFFLIMSLCHYVKLIYQYFDCAFLSFLPDNTGIAIQNIATWLLKRNNLIKMRLELLSVANLPFFPALIQDFPPPHCSAIIVTCVSRHPTQ